MDLVSGFRLSLFLFLYSKKFQFSESKTVRADQFGDSNWGTWMPFWALRVEVFFKEDFGPFTWPTICWWPIGNVPRLVIYLVFIKILQTACSQIIEFPNGSSRNDEQVAYFNRLEPARNANPNRKHVTEAVAIGVNRPPNRPLILFISIVCEHKNELE